MGTFSASDEKGNLEKTAIVWYGLWVPSIVSVYTKDKNYFSGQKVSMISRSEKNEVSVKRNLLLLLYQCAIGCTVSSQGAWSYLQRLLFAVKQRHHDMKLWRNVCPRDGGVTQWQSTCKMRFRFQYTPLMYKHVWVWDAAHCESAHL